MLIKKYVNIKSKNLTHFEFSRLATMLLLCGCFYTSLLAYGIFRKCLRHTHFAGTQLLRPTEKLENRKPLLSAMLDDFY